MEGKLLIYLKITGGAAEFLLVLRPNFLYLKLLFPYLPVPEDDILRRCQCLQSHRSSCVKLLGADPDLRAEPELKPVRESGRRVHIHSRRIDLILELQGIVIIIRDYGL